MRKRDKLAVFLYGLVALTNLVMGLIYATRREFMPYHARAVGGGWGRFEAGERELILALMRLGAAGFLAVGIALGVLILVPFRRNEGWSRWAIPVVGLGFWVPVFIVTVIISVNTPASAPWPGSLAAVLVILLGAVLSFSPGGRA